MFLFFKIEWPLIKTFKTNLGDKEHMKVHFIMLRDNILGGIYSDKNKPRNVNSSWNVRTDLKI